MLISCCIILEKKKTLDANKLQLFSLLTIAWCLKFIEKAHFIKLKSFPFFL